MATKGLLDQRMATLEHGLSHCQPGTYAWNRYAITSTPLSLLVRANERRAVGGNGMGAGASGSGAGNRSAGDAVNPSMEACRQHPCWRHPRQMPPDPPYRAFPDRTGH